MEPYTLRYHRNHWGSEGSERRGKRRRPGGDGGWGAGGQEGQEFSSNAKRRKHKTVTCNIPHTRKLQLLLLKHQTTTNAWDSKYQIGEKERKNQTNKQRNPPHKNRTIPFSLPTLENKQKLYNKNKHTRTTKRKPCRVKQKEIKNKTREKRKVGSSHQNNNKNWLEN